MQRRCRERRIGVALGRFFIDAGNPEIALFNRRFDGVGSCFFFDVELFQRRAGDCRQARLEIFAFGRRQHRFDGPVFIRLESFDFRFPVAHDAQHHRLHAPRRSRARQLAPQHRRQREADEIVERSPGEIGRDQRLIDLARFFHRRQDRLLGDGVEGHALDLQPLLDGLLLNQNFEDVPGNGFAFAIRVGRENELVGAFYGLCDLAHDLLRARIDVPMHCKIVVRLHRSVLRRQVAHVAIGGDDFVV